MSTTRLVGHALQPFLGQLVATDGNVERLLADPELPSDKVEVLHEVVRILEEAHVLYRVSGEQDACEQTVAAMLAANCGEQRSVAEIRERLTTASVRLVGESSISGRVVEGLAEYGITGVTSVSSLEDSRVGQEPADVSVLFVDDLFDPLLDKWNRDALEQGSGIWLPVCPPRGHTLRVGPWFYPGGSACYTCYRIRRASAIPEPELRSANLTGTSLRPDIDRYAARPAASTMLVGMVVNGIAQHFALDGLRGQATPGGMVTLRETLFGYELDNHRVLRVPRCSSCSPASGTGYPQVWFHDEGSEQ